MGSWDKQAVFTLQDFGQAPASARTRVANLQRGLGSRSV